MTNTATADRQDEKDDKKNGQDNQAGKGSEVTSLAVRSESARTHHIVPLPNNRPITRSLTRYLEVSSLPGGRPISVSSFEVVAYLPGHRPIAATTHKYVTSDTLPGHRPVSVGTLHYDHNNLLPGGRPIASNTDQATSTLIGYLD
ncbi:hypothetical protein BST81_23025 [Leptolyngbya sp. 'hensonii']|uniref:hypothetical protein n=1 Tax=Leptolyngbya sp. 'hensonii' TaxID=1922337 RepID=UPI00094F813F|nr:hypothetical protein [Leptolyngbya sp. 'hensonii']OLP16102.1 hypothetical protein BST81_23025 [Leptolyngbya sp. 'hensonii']